MKTSERIKLIISRLEIVVAVILFFVMLFSCGLYIDIKLNGKISNLPPLSENDYKMLLRSSLSDDEADADDLLEPVFLGVKDSNQMMAVCPSDEIRNSFVGLVGDVVSDLFNGTVRTLDFSGENEFRDYVDTVKSGDRFILLSFFDDLPSSVVVPCMFDSIIVDGSQKVFDFKHLFLLPDEDGNLYACALNSENTVTEMYPEQSVGFDKILGKTYDKSDGWIEFEFLTGNYPNPVYLSSLIMSSYIIEPLSTVYGKDDGQKWVKNLFDVFSLNENLVRSFTSGDKTEINYVEESGELIINDDGLIEFKASDIGGIGLEKYAVNVSDSLLISTFSDKIFGLKKIINRLFDGDYGFSFSMVGYDYDDDIDTLKVYFKYMTDGIFLYDDPYDAVFEICDNKLVYAKFNAIMCSRLTEAQGAVIPQKFASISVKIKDDSNAETYLFLQDNDGDGISTPIWGVPCVLSEVSD